MITIKKEVKKVVTEEFEDIEALVEQRCNSHSFCSRCPMYDLKKGVVLPYECRSEIVHFLYGDDKFEVVET